MHNTTKALNWLIGGYIGLKIFGYSTIIATDPSLRILFVLARRFITLKKRDTRNDGA